MRIDVIKQALAALEDAQRHHYALKHKETDELVTALRAAIEQAQEPIGHADLGISNIYIFSAFESREIPDGRTPLYTAPRQWQGLTNDEIDTLFEAHHNQHGECEVAGHGYERAIEAKLKEKNNAR